VGFRDVSKEIAEVANGYHFTKTPGFIEDVLGFGAKILRAILEFVRDLFSHGGGTLDSRGTSFLLQVAIFVAAAIAIVWVAIVLFKRARTATDATASTTKGATVVEELLDADGWAKHAEKLATSQDYKGACRAVYLSLLQNLHENGIAQFNPTKTNYEYSYSLTRHPEIQSDFKALAERVEVIWFGNKDATNDDYDLSKRQLSGMESEIRKIGAAKQASEKTPKP
jgi:hypothetical protein